MRWPLNHPFYNRRRQKSTAEKKGHSCSVENSHGRGLLCRRVALFAMEGRALSRPNGGHDEAWPSRLMDKRPRRCLPATGGSWPSNLVDMWEKDECPPFFECALSGKIEQNAHRIV